MAAKVLPVKAGRDAHFLGEQFYKVFAVDVAHRVATSYSLREGSASRALARSIRSSVSFWFTVRPLFFL